MWGENDPLVPLQYGQAMQQEIAGAKLVVIPRAAYVAMWDAPEEFNRAVLEFLDEVETRAADTTAQPRFSWGISGWTRIGDVAMAHRQAGRRRDIVLVHGLGMSSAYFKPLAAALFAAGWNPTPKRGRVRRGRAVINYNRGSRREECQIARTSTPPERLTR